MYCEYCGKKIKDGSRFCPYCGKQTRLRQPQEHQIDSPGESSDQPVTAGNTNHLFPADAGNENYAENNDVYTYDTAPQLSANTRTEQIHDSVNDQPVKRKKKKTGIVLGGIIAASVVAIVLVVAFMNRNRSSADTADETEDVASAAEEQTDGTAQERAQDENEQSGTTSSSLTEDILDKNLDIREDIRSAIASSNMISGEDFYISNDGKIHCSKSQLVKAYAYYGKDIKGLFDDIAITQDGSVYNYTTLVSDDADICFAGFKTHRTNYDAYLLSTDGNIYYYNPSENEFVQLSEDGGYTSVLRVRSYGLFFGEDSVSGPGGFMSGSSQDLSAVDVSDWKNIVVSAGACSDSGDWSTVAGIDKDGKLYATGEYADEILAMGDLSYIVMRDDASLIVGLTPEGTLKFAGRDTDELPDYLRNMQGVTGIRLKREAYEQNSDLWLRDANGEVSYWDLNNLPYAYNEDGTVVRDEAGNYARDLTQYEDALHEGEEFTDLYIDTDGKVYEQEEGGGYVRSKDYADADAGNSTGLVYYYRLTGSNFDKGYDTFQFLDINEDGEDELILQLTDSGPVKLAGLKNGELESYVDDVMLTGYYPESAVIATARPTYSLVEYYGTLANKVYTEKTEHSIWESQDFYFFYGKADDLPYTDEQGDALRESQSSSQSGEVAISKGEYDALIREMTNGEEMQEFSGNHLSISDENYAAALSVDLPGEAKNTTDGADEENGRKEPETDSDISLTEDTAENSTEDIADEGGEDEEGEESATEDAQEEAENTSNTTVEENNSSLKMSLLTELYFNPEYYKVTSVTASSESSDYPAANMTDGDFRTAWSENTSGLGIGTTITLTLDGTHEINGFEIVAGYTKSAEIANNNASPSELGVSCGGREGDISLSYPSSISTIPDAQSDDEDLNEYFRRLFIVEFSEPVQDDKLTLTILDANPGAKWEDLCISEVYVY